MYVANKTGLTAVMEHVRRRNSTFSHTARMLHIIPVQQALRRQIDLSLGRLPDKSSICRLGRPHKRWMDHVRDDNGLAG